MSESDFLRQQADAASRAIVDTLGRMRQSLKDSADVKAWTRAHPWPSLGVAAAVGFLAAKALAPRASRASTCNSSAAAVDEEEDERTLRRATRRKRSLIRKVVSPLFKTLVGALESSIVAAATAHFQQPPQDSSTNGHPPADSEVSSQ